MHFRALGTGVKRALLGTAVIGVALSGAASAMASNVGGSVTPAAGIADTFTSYCGTNWVKVHIPNTSYYNIYNTPEQQAVTCMTAEREHLWFVINSISYRKPWGYPNISSGWEAGISSCTGVSGACFTYPVKETGDGNPVTSVATWQNPGTYNASYDIWFNKTGTSANNFVQDNGTEIMIWLSHPGINESHAISRYVVIDGIRWGVMTWTAYNAKANVHWHYLVYMAASQRSSVTGLHLNPFFSDAIKYNLLSSSWYLTAIDFGFELVHGGVKNNVHYYSLTGLPTAAANS